MEKKWVIYVCMDKNVEGDRLNCYQRLPPEERVWREIFTLILMNILEYYLIFFSMMNYFYKVVIYHIKYYKQKPSHASLSLSR